MMKIIGSDGNGAIVKDFDDYLKYECNQMPLFTKEEYEYGYSLCDPNRPDRNELMIKHLKELIRAQWFYSRFLHKQFMNHYYYENFRLHDELRRIIWASSSKSKTAITENSGATPEMVPQ